jgi:WD40 repeat protein
VPCEAVAFSPDGKWLAAGFGGTSRVRVLNVADQTEVELRDATIPDGGVVSLAFSPDGKWLAAGVERWKDQDHLLRPGLVRVWDVANRSRHRDLVVSRRQPVRGITFGHDSRTLAAAVKAVENDPQPLVEIWDVETGGRIKTLGLLQASLGPCVAFARREPLLAVTTMADIEVYYPTAYERPERGIPTEGIEPAAVALSPDGTVLACSRGDIIGVYNAHDRTWRGPLKGQLGPIFALTFTADGKTLISGGADHTVREWTVPPAE